MKFSEPSFSLHPTKGSFGIKKKHTKKSILKIASIQPSMFLSMEIGSVFEKLTEILLQAIIQTGSLSSKHKQSSLAV